MGASFTEPDAWELVARVRVEEPAVAVIVTDDAFAVCHASVTLSPLLIEAGLAESVTLGAELALEGPTHEERPHTANKRVPYEIQRKAELFIFCMLSDEQT